MRLFNTPISSAIRLASAGTVILSILVSMASAAASNEFGVVSKNEADRPPVMNPDVASRSVDPDRPPAYGPEDAKVLIVLFSDYQCPSCRRVTQATHQISAEFPGDVRIEIWHRPLAMHRNAETAAAAAVAAQKQGKFWEMHDLIFQNQDSLDVADLEQHAQTLGLDLERFRSDMNDPAVRERIRAESALADELGAQATPGWLINGKVSQGWGSWWSFRRKVELELAAANELAAEDVAPFDIQLERALANHQDSESFELYRTNVLLPNRSPDSD